MNDGGQGFWRWYLSNRRYSRYLIPALTITILGAIVMLADWVANTKPLWGLPVGGGTVLVLSVGTAAVGYRWETSARREGHS